MNTTIGVGIAYEGISRTLKHFMEPLVHLAIILNEGFEILDDGEKRAFRPGDFAEGVIEPRLVVVIARHICSRVEKKTRYGKSEVNQYRRSPDVRQEKGPPLSPFPRPFPVPSFCEVGS
jgi:hypothetical protein